MARSSADQISDSPVNRPPARPVRLWHFIVLPTVSMGAMLLLSRVVDSLLSGRLEPAQLETYQIVRTVVISLIMATLIGWLAIIYRRQYESELRARNKALEKTRDFLSSIIEGSGEAIVTLDTEDRVISWNRAAEGIFGWQASEMLGQSVNRLLPDNAQVIADRQRVGERIRAGETVRDHYTKRIRKDGETVTVRITWSPLYGAGGEYVGCIGIVLDVSAEAEMRERLLEQERLAVVGELAAQVAHEVRNPLAGIRGACELIFSGRGDPKMQREVGREVLQQIDRLNHTVMDLLQFANPKSVAHSPTDLNGLIDRVVGLLREDPKATGVRLVRDYQGDLPPIPLDRAQMEQVFYNILLNAAQMMDFDGTITIRTVMENGEVRVTVRDTGPGIASGTKEKIFKLFFSTRVKGTGLGLAIVRKIMLAHHGTIQATSPPDGGAEFSLRLPAEPPPGS